MTAAAQQLQGRPSHVGAFTSMGQFSVIKELHRSSLGCVHVAKVKEPRRGASLVVLKRRRGAELGKQKDILNEYDVLRQLQHPNIIKCHGYFWDFDSGALCVVLEHADRGDLFREVQSRQRSGHHFSDKEVWEILGQVLDGLAYLHSKGVVHRDIKSLNLLLTSAGEVKLGDFGVSRQMSDETLCLNSFYGTPLYLSPEIIEGKPYTDTTDVWSLGVVLYELLALRPPFNGHSLQDVVDAVLRGRYQPLPRSRSSEFDSVVASMLSREPSRRPPAAELVQRLADKGVRQPWRPSIKPPPDPPAAPEQLMVQSAPAANGMEGPRRRPQSAGRVGREPVLEARDGMAAAAGVPSNGAQRRPQSASALREAKPLAEGMGHEEVQVVRVRRSTNTASGIPLPSRPAQLSDPSASTPSSPKEGSGKSSERTRSSREQRWEERRRMHEERQGRGDERIRVTRNQGIAAAEGRAVNGERAASAAGKASFKERRPPSAPEARTEAKRSHSEGAPSRHSPALNAGGYNGGYPAQPPPWVGRKPEAAPSPASRGSSRPSSGRYDIISNRWI